MNLNIKNFRLLNCGFLILFIMMIGSSLSWSEQKNDGQYKSFAVVELFTSQGCSSCPPADRVLHQLVDESRKKNLRVYSLAFHVDYWDDLGWKDIFSQQKFTHRQRMYGAHLNQGSIFTPQVMINGQFGINGARGDLIQKHINSFISVPADKLLTLKINGSNHSQVEVGFEIFNRGQHDLLNLALVERSLAVKILHGENAGLLMNYDNVVRNFKTIHIDHDSGVVLLEIPNGCNNKRLSIIGFLQNPESLAISAAHQVDMTVDSGSN